MIASPLAMAHTCAVVETNAPRFGDQTVLRRTTAARRILRPHPLWAGDCGEGSPLPVPWDAGSPTLLSARPPHLAMGCVFNRPQEPRNG